MQINKKKSESENLYGYPLNALPSDLYDLFHLVLVLKIQQSNMPKENVHQLAHFIQHSIHVITLHEY